MKTYTKQEVQFHIFLNLLHKMEIGGQLRCPGHYSLEDNVQEASGRWGCLRACLNTEEEEKSVLSLPEIETKLLDRPYRYAIFIPTEVTRVLKWYLTYIILILSPSGLCHTVT